VFSKKQAETFYLLAAKKVLETICAFILRRYGSYWFKFRDLRKKCSSLVPVLL